MKYTFRKRLLAVCVVCVFFAFTAFSQDLDQVSITGLVLDSNKAPIVGSTVVATIEENGFVRTVVTDENGRYRLIELPPGVYRIKVSADGFGTREALELETVSGQNVQLSFELDPADVRAETTINVSEETLEMVDTTRIVVGGTISSEQLDDLPISSRDPFDLVFTLGGTAEEALSIRDLSEDRGVTNSEAPAEQGNFSLSGGASYSNNLTIDGLDNNDDRTANLRFQPPIDSIKEVQVISNQFSAEYGRASGGRINLRTRAGSNVFRGRAYMFFKDDSLNANTWYNNSRGYDRLPYTDYDPGVTFSGPIIFPGLYDGRDRTFFSVSYEYDYTSDTTQINTYVPVGSNPNYTLPAGNETCPVESCVDTRSDPEVAILPYLVQYSTPNSKNSLISRVDQRINEKNDFTVGYQFGRSLNRRSSAETTTRLDEALQAKRRNTDAINFTDNHVFNGSAINQVRFQYSIYEPSYETDNPLEPVVLISYRDPETSRSRTLVAGNSTASGGTSSTFPQNRRESRYQFQESFTYLWRDHNFKIGADIQSINSEALGLDEATGTFNFSNVGDYENNQLSRYRQNFGTRSDVKNNYYGFYFNDEFQLMRRMTVSAGIRYEKESSVDDKNNFGPRFGMAWSPFDSGKGVVRFGAGIFYNRTLLRTIADFIQNANGVVPFDTNQIGTSSSDPRRVGILAALSQRFPNTYATEDELHTLIENTCLSITTTFTCDSDTGFIVNAGTTGNPLRSVSPDLRIPESYQANVGFEYEIFKGIVLEANYTWNKTIHLWRDINNNAPILPEGYSDWTEYLLANPFQLSSSRMYTFYLGDQSDSVGITTEMNGTSRCGTTTANCFVNLNSSSTSTSSPAVAVPGLNGNSTGSPIGIAHAAIAGFRPDQEFEEKSRIESIGNSLYHGLILEMRSRMRDYGGGFRGSYRFAYTLSSTKNDGLNNTSNAEINGDFSREFARANQDRRHRIAFSGTFETPVWLGGIRLSPLFRFGSPKPFNIGNGGRDRNLDDVSTDRLNFSGNLDDIVWREPGAAFPAELASQFSLPTIGAVSGNLPRNAGTGPTFYTFDLNVARDFRFGERMRLRPQIEFDNILNAAVFNYGAAFINFRALGSTATESQIEAFQSSFLVPTRTYRQRQIRLGIRFYF